MRKIGVYGGTFDPVHHAHLILAREAYESLGLETVILVPAAVAPGKQPPLASAETRLAMLRAAIEYEKMFTVEDCELRRSAPSYTIDTVRQILEREKDARIFCLIGDDNLPTLRNWHRFQELETLVQFVVLDRTGSCPDHPYQTVRRRIEISASEIRKRVASGRSIRYLVPEVVERMIRQGNLYRGSEK